MKLTQIQEASYHDQQAGWGVKVEIKHEEHICGPFSSKEEAEDFLNRVDRASEEEGWYERNEFDLYDDVVKFVSPKELINRLKI